MPDVLAIHWERRRLRVIEASIGSVVRVQQGFTVDIPEAPPAGWLREALRKHGVNAKQALVALSREEAILRQLELPNAPEDELPSLVHFQASTRSTTPLDQLLLDFMPLPDRSSSEQKDVLLATVPRSFVEPIRTALTDAGLELSLLTLSSFALAEFAVRMELSRQHATSRRSLVVLQDGLRLEVVLMGQQQPLVTHLVRAMTDDQGHPVVSKAAADISRVLVPAQSWLVDSPLERIWILGDSPDWKGLDQALGQRWNCPVEHFDGSAKTAISELDVFKLNASLIEYAPALGLALCRVHRRSPAFDLLHPRQPKPKRDPRKLQLAVGSAAALAVVAMATSYIQLTMSSLEEQIQSAKKAEDERTRDLKVGEPVSSAAKTIDEWVSRDVNQLRQLADLNATMEGTSRLYVADYNFTSSTGDVIAKLLATGNARDRLDWQQVAQRLVDSRRYRVNPRESTAQSRDADYPHRFELDTELIPPGKAPAAQPQASPPEKAK